MKKVILDRPRAEDVVYLSDTTESTPIFAKDESGKLAGMLTHERANGWIVKVGGVCGCSGHWENRLECMRDAERLGFTFFVDDGGGREKR